MKTRNNQLVALAVFAFLFLVGNVSAKGTETSASSHENIEEQALEIENWMMNESNWNTADFAYELMVEVEEEMQLKNWMINDSNWDAFYNSELLTDVQEDEIHLENWMTDKWVWMVPEKAEKEADLVTEAWMENDNVWFR